MISFEPTSLPGSFLIRSHGFSDDRGEFIRLFCEDEFRRHKLAWEFPQQNLSSCRVKGVLRGLHYQVPPHAEAKLVHCVRGAVFDAIVDMRRGSPTFLSWFGMELTQDDLLSIYVPPGFAHGYQALEDRSTVVYSASSVYVPECERLLRYDDPSVGVVWPIRTPILSYKDRSADVLSAEFEGVVI